ncbi:MAG: DUF2177 family protein [Pseudomonadota bacterium]
MLRPTEKLISLLCIYGSFAVMDVAWLGFIASGWYQQEMANLLRKEVITWPWVVFYLLYGLSLFTLIVAPNIGKKWMFTAGKSALFGLTCYGTYNLTNYSVIESFTLKIMLLDWVWGVIITTFSGLAGCFGISLFRSQQRKHLTD